MQLKTIAPGPAHSFNMLVDEINDRVIAPYILEHGIWEPMETQIVMRLLKSGQNVIDVGANIGYYTLLCASLVGSGGKVIGFEPEEDNYALLEANVRINGMDNIELENRALSDREKDALLYLSDTNKGDHRLAHVANRESRRVNCTTLDSRLAGSGLDIHFLKSDTQGHELRILRGMQAVLRKNIDHLCCLLEFSPGLLQDSEAGGIDAFLHFFDQYPAEIYWISGKGGSARLIKVDTHKLHQLALAILEHGESDYSRDILVFFNSTARRFHLSELEFSVSAAGQADKKRGFSADDWRRPNG